MTFQYYNLEGGAFKAEVAPGRQLQSEAPVDVDQVPVRGQEKVAVMPVLDLQKKKKKWNPNRSEA